MEDQIFFLDMFPDYEPPEELYAALSQAAIAAADIDPETRSVHVALHSERYIPNGCWNRFARTFVACTACKSWS